MCRWKLGSDSKQMKRNGKPVLEFVAITRKDTGEAAIPGVSQHFSSPHLLWNSPQIQCFADRFQHSAYSKKAVLLRKFFFLYSGQLKTDVRILSYIYFNYFLVEKRSVLPLPKKMGNCPVEFSVEYSWTLLNLLSFYSML